MKKLFANYAAVLLLLCSLSFVATSCSKDDDDTAEPQTFASLFAKTDHFVDMLDAIYERYDAYGKKAADSSDGKFTVTPIGRLIIVKKKSSASDITYSEVQSALEEHYKNESKVNDVFINSGGTVTIDCRK